MKLKTEAEVKKWLRGLPLTKKELKMKIEFYSDLILDAKNLGSVEKVHTDVYLTQIQALHDRIRLLGMDMDRLLETLDPDERLILTARYIRRLTWDAMEFHIHYSRRQSIRIHNRAIRNLIGSVVGGNANGTEK